MLKQVLTTKGVFTTKGEVEEISLLKIGRLVLMKHLIVMQTHFEAWFYIVVCSQSLTSSYVLLSYG